MSSNKKYVISSKKITKKPQNPESSNCFESNIQVLKTSILSNIEVGESTMSQLNEIAWKSIQSDMSIKNCYKCPLCSKVYAQGQLEPICLPCGHTFCRQCLVKLKTTSWSGSCPYDSTEFFFINDFLPVNYSLLECDSDPYPNTCLKHNSSLIAFCIDDLRLLCGKCLFSHYTHRIIELSSDKALEISKQNLENFKKLEIKLKDLLVCWEEYRNLLVGNVENVKNTLLVNVSRIREAESEIIMEIHERTEKLIKTILDFQEVITVKSIENAEKVIECIKFHVECAESFSRYYPNMNTCERLAVNMLYEDVFQDIKAISTHDLKNLEINDYKKAIVPTV